MFTIPADVDRSKRSSKHVKKGGLNGQPSSCWWVFAAEGLYAADERFCLSSHEATKQGIESAAVFLDSNPPLLYLFQQKSALGKSSHGYKTISVASSLSSKYEDCFGGPRGRAKTQPVVQVIIRLLKQATAQGGAESYL